MFSDEEPAQNHRLAASNVMEINDADPVLPVVPVLSYANPLGGQPLDSRLVVEQLGDRVVVTDPRSARMSPVLLKYICAATLMGAIFAIAEHWNDILYRGEAFRLNLSTFVAAMGLFVIWRAKNQKPKPRILSVEPGRCFTTGCPGHDWFSKHFRPRKFIAVGPLVDLRTLRTVYHLNLAYGLPFSFQLVPDLLRIETVWLVRLLNDALHAKDSPLDTSGEV